MAILSVPHVQKHTMGRRQYSMGSQEPPRTLAAPITTETYTLHNFDTERKWRPNCMTPTKQPKKDNRGICQKCKQEFDLGELYEYRGFEFCEEHFDEGCKRVDEKRQEVMEVTAHSIKSQRNGEFANNRSKYHLGNVAPDRVASNHDAKGKQRPVRELVARPHQRNYQLQARGVTHPPHKQNNCI